MAFGALGRNVCRPKDFSVSIPVFTTWWLHQKSHIPQSGADHVAWIIHHIHSFALAYVWHLRIVKLLSVREDSTVSTSSLDLPSELSLSVKGNPKIVLQSCAFERLMRHRPWKITNANFTTCLSLQNLQSFTGIKKDNRVLEGYFCKLFLWFNRRNYLRFPIRKHSSSTGKGFRGPDGASFFLCLISTICCNDSRLPACA